MQQRAPLQASDIGQIPACSQAQSDKQMPMFTGPRLIIRLWCRPPLFRVRSRCSRAALQAQNSRGRTTISRAQSPFDRRQNRPPISGARCSKAWLKQTKACLATAQPERHGHGISGSNLRPPMSPVDVMNKTVPMTGTGRSFGKISSHQVRPIVNARSCLDRTKCERASPKNAGSGKRIILAVYGLLQLDQIRNLGDVMEPLIKGRRARRATASPPRHTCCNLAYSHGLRGKKQP